MIARWSRLVVGAAVAFAVLTLAGCSTSARITTGEWLDASARSFVELAEQYRTARDAGIISDVQYAQFAVWGEAFRQAWLRAYQLWQAGENPREIRALIDQWRNELALWAARLAAAREKRP